MKRLSLSLLMLAALALLVAACGGGGPAPSQATVPPPTATTEPTAEPLPVASPLATLGPGVFTDALAKSKTVSSYRLDMQMAGSGPFNPMNAAAGQAGATPTASPSDQPVSLITMKGEVKGKDSHMLMQGVMASFIGADPTKGLEVTVLGDNAYVHGPLPMLGGNEDKWYQIPATEAANLTPGVQPGELFDQFTQTGLNPNDFTKSGSESLDNQTCDVYTGDQAATLHTFQELNKTTSSGQASNFDIDKADFRFWVCGDGYLHQVRLSIDGHSKQDPNTKGSYLVLMHIYDLNSDITITAPAGAVPLPTPAAGSSGLPGETPTP